MITEKRISEIKQRIPLLIKNGLITLDKSNRRFSEFFVMNGDQSLKTADLLYKISSDLEIKQKHP